MKRAFFLLVPAFALLLAAVGCQDESKPTFTRLRVMPSCGVVPLNVEGYAIISGGNESGDPMGGNNNLEIRWNFGDGGSGNTTVAYHRYDKAGEYDVVVTGTDPDGNSTSTSVPVTVLSDSLIVTAESSVPSGNVTTDQTIGFGFSEVISCDIDYPAVQGDSVKVAVEWEMGDAAGTKSSQMEPEFRYTVPGVYQARVTVFYPAWAVFRRDTLDFTVTAP